MAIINSVIAGGGTTPTGTKTITTNGTHDVTDYASADVQVPTTAPTYYIERSVRNGYLTGYNVTNVIDMTNVTGIAPYGLAWAYSRQNPSGSDTDLIGGATDPYPFSNIDIIWPLQNVGSMGLYRTFYGRGGINSAQLGDLSYNLSNCTETFSRSDVKSCSLYSSVMSGMIATFATCESLTSANVSCSILGNSCVRTFNWCPNLATLTVNTPKIGYSASNNPTAIEFVTHSKLTSLDMSATTLIQGYGYIYDGGLSGQYGSATRFCAYNTLLTNVNIKNLTEIKTATSSAGLCVEMFRECTALESQKFESLNIIGGYGLNYGFRGCTALKSVWFYGLTTIGGGALNNMLSGCSNVTAHFPMAIQSTYSSDTRFTGGFSGTNTTVLFDLVTSLTGADTNTYTRSEKDSTTTATAWTYNDTLYYTSGVSDNTNGVNEPAVGDTIYSDAACTTAVTTISAIA